MGMYNLVFGSGERGLPLLRALGFNAVEDVGRYRDGWVEKDGEGGYRIAIYTRNGGGNRPEYMPDLSGNEYYLFDKDDTFDTTYATIYFRLPQVLADAIAAARAENPELDMPDPVDMDERWQHAISVLGEPAAPDPDA
jgi:hypothetical protein